MGNVYGENLKELDGMRLPCQLGCNGHERLQRVYGGHIHGKNIVHADVGSHNLLLDGSGHIKYIDFAGSGIDGEPALVCYEWCSFRPTPSSMPDIQTDIFAFGSMLFEIESGNLPYQELEEIGEFDRMKQAEHLSSL